MKSFLQSFYDGDGTAEEKALSAARDVKRDVLVIPGYGMGEDEEEDGGNCGTGCGGCGCKG